MQDNVGERPSSVSIFGEDGKLSSASAATSLKYARPQDLPSYPSSGGVQLSSAGAAASLAASNRKTFEHWKPEPIPAANKAAMLAKDHKMDPSWKPEISAAGSKAAMMAHANPKEIEPLQPKTTSTIKPYDTPESTHQKALIAANAASKNRRRSGSMPSQTEIRPTNASSWALKAATTSHKVGPPPVSKEFTTGDPGFEAARIQNIAKQNVNRQLYSSAPPVAIEVQEKNRQDTLRASAVAMAQKMYAIQQKHLEEATAKSDSQALAASRARRSTFTGSSAGSVGSEQASTGVGYENLEEAARRLAQERLAKIYDEHAEYRQYYGQQSPPARSRLSMKLRPRASSVTNDDDSDEENSRRIKSQMSIFKSNIAEVDSKKRQQDRDNLLQIAHRNVDKQIRQMDDKVFQDTGKASPAQMEKWEKAAREKAQHDSDVRMQNVGKVHIGGGKYLDQSELDAIAKARLQPTLDDITEKAEKQRARDEEERLERERKLAEAQRDKTRAAETAAQVKAENERQKQELKARKDEEKRALKEGQAAEKSRKEEEKRLQKAEAAADKERARLDKDEKKKSKDTKPGRISTLLGRGGVATTDTPITSSAPDERVDREVTHHPTIHDQVTEPTPGSVSPVITKLEPAAASPADAQIEPVRQPTSVEASSSTEIKNIVDEEHDASPTKSRVKSWMRGHFRSKSDDPEEKDPIPAIAEGGASEKGKNVEQEDHVPRTESMRDVAMAGRTASKASKETDDLYGAGRATSPEENPHRDIAPNRSPSISSISSTYSQEVKINTDFSLGTTAPLTADDAEQEEKQGIKRRLLKKIRPVKDQSKTSQAEKPVVADKSDDEFEEARDKFEEEKLAPPPPLSSTTGEESGTKPIAPKGSREVSRFTEVL